MTDVVADPRNPDVLYAATWQRHRNVAAYMGGGPGSGLHRSTDGGESWQKLTKGLPDLIGKIGVDAYLSKPTKSAQLRRTIGGVLGRGAPRRPADNASAASGSAPAPDAAALMGPPSLLNSAGT